jgi:hypothetical protein
LRIFFSNLRPVKAITVWVYLMSALGIAKAGAIDEPGLTFLFRVFPPDTWAFLFLVMGCCRIIGLYVWGGNLFFRLLVAGIGIWIWSMMLVSEIILEDAHMSLNIIPLLCIEVWIVSQYLTERLDELRKQEVTNGRW